MKSAEARRALRHQLLARRRALSAAEWVSGSAAIAACLRASFSALAGRRVAFCWPVSNEPDLRPLLGDWARAAAPGFQALLPVVIAPQTPLAFRAWPGAALYTADAEAATAGLELDRHGIPHPASGDWVVPEVLLIPVNGVDAAGYRLGYGGGYFDRTLATLSPRPLAIGVGFEFARVTTVWPQAHDQPLDALVTEAGVHRFRV
ncbi:5-formyltetrahydrofolate cyclo-ligase [Rhodocyclus purpureus]|uniref:5-formyltetrahydrofolate cyclo-ligase n=1 Tax=Rhodocyclus purpureus TaxID=1067 RepID=UPI001914B20F|nr:5-formyltetrahydrofolate cyclo-ligase [Rhodocyclus purpureus]MBK5913957.1 5-formyltetrahydrofolate cyclo-ligase [Rhodocyclus purpureus]